MGVLMRSQWFRRQQYLLELQPSWISAQPGDQGMSLGYPKSLVFYLGNRVCYLKASSPGSTAESFSWLLPSAARCWLSPSPELCGWLWLWEGTRLPVRRPGKRCLDPWCCQNFSGCWEGAPCVDKTGWCGISLCFTGLLYAKPWQDSHRVSPGSSGTGHRCRFCSLTQYSQRSHVMWDVSVSC